MKKLANILFISAMLIFGTIGIIVKFIPLDASEIAFYRSILALLVISLYFIIKKEKFKFNLKKNTLILLLLSGIGIGLNWIFLFESYNYTSLSISTVCNYFAPIIVMVLSPIILKEKISLKQVICLIIAVVGLILIVGAFEFKKDSNNLIGIILSLLAAALYAVVILINKKINFVDGIERTFFQFLSLAIVLLPYTLFTTGFNVFKLSITNLLWLLLLGVVHTGIAYCLYFTSIKDMSGQKISILSFIDPVTSIMLAFFIFNDQLTGLQLVGALLILFATIFSEIRIKKVKKEV
jgi:RarD protein